MIGGVQPKILLTQDENGNLKMDEEMGKLLFGDPKMNWKLVRERDGLTKESKDILWIEWNEDGTFKEKHSEIGIGRSLIMSPFTASFTWQTTDVTEILENGENLIKFRTSNSNYELSRIL